MAELGCDAELCLRPSLGELMAEHTAGIMDLSDACRLVQAQSGHHGMVSIPRS